MHGSDSREAALDYFHSLDNGDLRDDVLEAFIDNAPEALRFLEANSRVQFTALESYPDYYGDRAGARPDGGRALDSGLFAFSDLGEWRDRVAIGTVYPLTVAETPLGGGSGILPTGVLEKRLERDMRGFGQSLVGGLLEACLQAGVDIRLDQDVKALITKDGHVTGLTMDMPTGRLELTSRLAIVVATGGFEWNDDLARAFLRGPIAYPASPPTNTGDGLKLLMSVGAALGNMTSAWWCPTIATGEQWSDGSARAVPVLIERTLPGCIIVNANGKRFCNEAVNYSAIAGAFHAFDPNHYAYLNQPAWLVFDNDYKQRWPVATALPGNDMPEWMVSAPTLSGLAASLDIPADNLEATVERFNAGAELGIDEDFHRGVKRYDRFYGDRSRPDAFATLGPILAPPYFAVRLHLGVLGTNGGARTDGCGRVLDHHGAPIEGLFAAGNVIACPTGGVYAGAGGTLGPALTFGYLAGRSAARSERIG
jgi:3-oxosteroid 1-dehydrogenase